LGGEQANGNQSLKKTVFLGWDIRGKGEKRGKKLIKGRKSRMTGQNGRGCRPQEGSYQCVLVRPRKNIL
jgi:hypothetical protein